MSHTRTYIFLILFLANQPLIAMGADPILRLEPLIEGALRANPQLQVARQRTAAAREEIPQAGALDDPMLGFGVVNVPESFDFNAEDMTMKEISLSQKVPFWGKRRLIREAAEFQAQSTQADIDETANQVVKNVKLVFWDLSHVHRAIEVTGRNKKILEDFSKLAQTRYSVGQGIQEDVIRVQVEISRMLDELLMLDQRRYSLEAKLNLLLNRTATQPLGVPENAVFTAYDLNVDRLQQSALATSPMLRGIQRDIAAGEKGLSLARRERIPDFNFKATYGQRDNRADLISAMVELNLPVFTRSKQSRKVDQASADLAARQARYEAVRNDLFYMIADMASMAQRLELQIELYRTGIIPQTTLQIQSALSAYTVNKADFMTVLDSRMRLYRFELDYHQAVSEYAKSITALEAAVGAPLTPGEEKK